MKLLKFELNKEGVKNFLEDPELRQVLKDRSEELLAAIPESDGDPDKLYDYKGGDKRVHGRYRKKFMEEAHANDGRVSYKVGVDDAQRSFFTLMTLQKSLRTIGAKSRRRRGKR